MPPSPYRGTFGAPRPAALDHLALPPQPMPSRQGLRPLKQWRYVGVYGPEVMLCAAMVRVGPGWQTFWAVWDRSRGELRERTLMGRGPVVALQTGRVRVEDRTVRFELAFDEASGIESINPSGASYAWTRKQAGIAVTGDLIVDGRAQPITGHAVIDDTAGYYERHTRWRWSAGVGETTAGQRIAWNLVEGVNDPATDSERTIWIDGVPYEPAPQTISTDLSRIGSGLCFTPEATRARSENRLIVRSRYRQPFGTFRGTLDGVTIAEAYGVMEDHDVWW